MGDPVMQSILQQAQGNPAALQDHMRNPIVRDKIDNLYHQDEINFGPRRGGWPAPTEVTWAFHHSLFACTLYFLPGVRFSLLIININSQRTRVVPSRLASPVNSPARCVAQLRGGSLLGATL